MTFFKIKLSQKGVKIPNDSIGILLICFLGKEGGGVDPINSFNSYFQTLIGFSHET